MLPQDIEAEKQSGLSVFSPGVCRAARRRAAGGEGGCPLQRGGEWGRCIAFAKEAAAARGEEDAPAVPRPRSDGAEPDRAKRGGAEHLAR